MSTDQLEERLTEELHIDPDEARELAIESRIALLTQEGAFYFSDEDQERRLAMYLYVSHNGTGEEAARYHRHRDINVAEEANPQSPREKEESSEARDDDDSCMAVCGSEEGCQSMDSRQQSWYQASDITLDSRVEPLQY